MNDKQSALGFWNRGMVGLGLLFVVPAALVVGGFFVVALNGRPAGGVDTQCEKTIGAVDFRIDIYSYTAGLTSYQQQGLAFRDGENSAWVTVFDDVVQAPDGSPCDEAIIIETLPNDTHLAWHRKNVALITPGSAQPVHNVCDEPRPDDSRCDEDELDFVAATFSDDQNGAVTVRRFIVDEYGQRVSADGELRVAEEYTLVTSDGGLSWQLHDGAAS